METEGGTMPIRRPDPGEHHRDTSPGRGHRRRILAPRELALYSPYSPSILRDILRAAITNKMDRDRGAQPTLQLYSSKHGDRWPTRSDMEVEAASGPVTEAQHWAQEARALGFAALVFAMLLMLLRLSDTCRERYYARRRRLASQFYSRNPNLEMGYPGDENDPYHYDRTPPLIDCPPPYSPTGEQRPAKRPMEELPPPYNNYLAHRESITISAPPNIHYHAGRRHSFGNRSGTPRPQAQAANQTQDSRRNSLPPVNSRNIVAVVQVSKHESI